MPCNQKSVVLNCKYVYFIVKAGNKIMLTVNDFQEAAARLKNVVHTIPLSTSSTFSQMTGAEVYLKCL